MVVGVGPSKDGSMTGHAETESWSLQHTSGWVPISHEIPVLLYQFVELAAVQRLAGTILG